MNTAIHQVTRIMLVAFMIRFKRKAYKTLPLL